MRGHGLDAVQLAGVLLPRLLQHRQVVPAPAHAPHLLGADGGEETRSPEVAAQPEERNVHPKAVMGGRGGGRRKKSAHVAAAAVNSKQCVFSIFTGNRGRGG